MRSTLEGPSAAVKPSSTAGCAFCSVQCLEGEAALLTAVFSLLLATLVSDPIANTDLVINMSLVLFHGK